MVSQFGLRNLANKLSVCATSVCHFQCVLSIKRLSVYLTTVLAKATAVYILLFVVSIIAALTIVTNVAIATGPAVFCVEFVHYYMQRWTLEFRCPRQTLRKRDLYFTRAIQKLYSLKAS